MVTTDEIAEVPLFAGLSVGDRERLSRTSADISLAEKTIGYQARVTFKEGLRRAFDDYRTA